MMTMIIHLNTRLVCEAGLSLLDDHDHDDHDNDDGDDKHDNDDNDNEDNSPEHKTRL